MAKCLLFKECFTRYCMSFFQPKDDILSSLFSIEYDPPVLSTITSTEMVNLFPFPHRDAKYPPTFEDTQTPDVQDRVIYQRERLMSDQLMAKFQTFPLKRSYSVHPRFHAGQTLRLSSVSTKPELPISEELQRSIPWFCFPGNFCLTAWKHYTLYKMWLKGIS